MRALAEAVQGAEANRALRARVDMLLATGLATGASSGPVAAGAFAAGAAGRERLGQVKVVLDGRQADRDAVRGERARRLGETAAATHAVEARLTRIAEDQDDAG